MRFWGYLLLLAFVGLAVYLITNPRVRPVPVNPTWVSVYEHDAEGVTLSGSKEALIEAVRAGQPIRVYWAGRRVEHATDAGFLTILQGEVFAQIPEILGQQPSVDPPAIAFREPEGTTWTTILATNGNRALKWFAQP
ncbi:MAG: hypothetical protein HKN21_05235 [Candidatus Eisenbacteria bacterium]|uniref:Uncharacterized protein n=1 Tax=Eiseniibacteriota bacterium TaxID=2212470 RepID=A0A7Y2EA71_UNCEI|nr:hypothetical protein [Candidatus Eisenbacteria bacterium]